MLPLLVVLFLISYVLLTTLVVLQDRTIDSQRGLIHLLFSDNLQMVASKMGLHRNASARSNQAAMLGSVSGQTSSQIPSTQIRANQAQTTQAQSTQSPSNQVSAAQTPSTQVPVIQAKPETSAKSGRNSRKAHKAVPVRPPAEMTDPSDMRRVSISI